MNDFTNEERRQILGEAMMDELRVIREYLGDIPTRTEFKRLEAKVDKLSDDMNVVKSVAKSHSSKLQNHEKRLTLLERAA